MSADKALMTAAITHVEFARSVDRDVLRQICDLNLRGLQAIAALRDGLPTRPAAFAQFDDLSRNEDRWHRLSGAPFLLFEWRPLVDWRVHEPTDAWRESAQWVDFARLATHVSAEICRNRRSAAVLLLGMPADQCDAWSRFSLAEIDLRAQRAAQQIDLRWFADPRFWQRRLHAVSASSDDALWRNTLEGMQRLAALARPSG
jgi:hypothetical protein